METSTFLLAAIDDSETASKALDYVAHVAKGREGVRVHLFTSTDPIPPALREFGGAEHPEVQKSLNRTLKEEQGRWRRQAERSAEPILDDARRVLESAGVKPENIATEVRSLVHREDLADELLKAARENGCDTIVVGRSCFSWIKEAFVSHVGEELGAEGRRDLGKGDRLALNRELRFSLWR